MKTDMTSMGLFAAGAMNIGGVLVFSRAFTNEAINDADPVVMSNFGLLMIAIWGLAYWGAATMTSPSKWLIGAFAIEKLAYVVAWSNWLAGNSLEELYSNDFFAGVFYSIYGPNDFIFMLFFVWVLLQRRPGK